jgi:hypothetical protein
MAELTTLEEKLAEVLGLAQAAQKATDKVEGLVEDDGIAESLTMAEAGEVGALRLAGDKDPYEES